MGAVAPDPDPTDPVGQTSHGTAVAGILGAAFNNGVGGVGVAPNARFLAIRSCWDDDDCFQSIQADAVDWAVARGVRVFSMSWLADKDDYEMSFKPSVAAASNRCSSRSPAATARAASSPTSTAARAAIRRRTSSASARRRRRRAGLR